MAENEAPKTIVLEKPLTRMNKTELMRIGDEIGVVLTEDTPNATMIEEIKVKMKEIADANPDDQSEGVMGDGGAGLKTDPPVDPENNDPIHARLSIALAEGESGNVSEVLTEALTSLSTDLVANLVTDAVSGIVTKAIADSQAESGKAPKLNKKQTALIKNAATIKILLQKIRGLAVVSDADPNERVLYTINKVPIDVKDIKDAKRIIELV